MTYELFILALDIWRESSNQTHAAKVGIGWVIRNRADHPGWWGKTLIEVITHKWQFSSMSAPGDPNLVRWPQEGDLSWDDAQKAAQEALTGTTDPTGGATYYYTYPLTAPPAEWGPVSKTAMIDQIQFCRA